MIENWATGERIRILSTGAETGGRLLAFELQLAPGGRVPAPHLHPEQEETFSVQEGQLRLRAGRRTRLLSPGEMVTVPRGVPHGFSNPGPGAALLLVEVRPALRMEEALEAGTRLGQRPAPLALARYLAEFTAEVRSPLLPGLVSRAARLLARLSPGPILP